MIDRDFLSIETVKVLEPISIDNIKNAIKTHFYKSCPNIDSPGLLKPGYDLKITYNGQSVNDIDLPEPMPDSGYCAVIERSI